MSIIYCVGLKKEKLRGDEFYLIVIVVFVVYWKCWMRIENGAFDN